MSSETRIPTTHVGSLPRPQEVVELVFAQDRGEPVDPAEFDRVIGGAVSDRVRHQVDAGVDWVSDGEMSKIGYATYIRHRLSGFELGDAPRATPADLDAYPGFRDRWPGEGGSARYQRPICRGPITYEHADLVQRDLAHLDGGHRRPGGGGGVHERALSGGSSRCSSPTSTTGRSTSTWTRSARR